jgi:hypothetical protein
VACEEGSRQRHSVLLEGASISGKFMDETRLHESIAGDRQMHASQIRSKCQSGLRAPRLGGRVKSDLL